MGPIYEALGMTVGVVQSGQDREAKRIAYEADITYGTNNEFGFDYLRDNMAFTADDKVQRSLDFAIVDEVDSILIDEARTPLIISGPAEASTDLYQKINRLAPRLTQQEKVEAALPRVIAGEEGEREDTGDFFVDEKNRQVELTERGHEFVERELKRLKLLDENDSLYAAANLGLLHHVHAALKAHFLFRRDVDYMVQDGEIVIVDEHTGRAMPGRRWSEGIHQAVEAKEGVAIRSETQTLASTTFQNYFRLYGKLSGMTGTADTEAFEFRQIYGLEVLVIPTHMPMVREDFNDHIYLTIDEKYDAIVEDINEATEAGRPVLVAGSMGPTGELLEPMGNMSAADCEAAFAEQAEGLAAGGADVLWIETMSDLDEVEAAVLGARSACDLEVAATMSFDTAGRTMMGVTGAELAERLDGLGLAAIGANCGNNIPDTEVAVITMATASTATPVISKPNAGVPVWSGDALVYDGTPEVLAAHAHRARAAGVAVIGSCCGSTPAHTAKIAAVLRGDEPPPDIELASPSTTPGTEDRLARRRTRRRGQSNPDLSGGTGARR